MTRLPGRSRVTAVIVVAVMALVLTGCTPSHGGAATPTPTSSAPAGLGGGGGESTSPTPSRSTIFSTPTPHLNTVAPAAEIDSPCPYASTAAFGDAEGDNTVRSVQLPGSPRGCRFYFLYDPSVVIGEILIEKFGTAVEAFNAVVVASRGHPEVTSDASIGDGSVTIKLPLQGTDTWATIFAKGRYAVIAHTRQVEVGEDARNVARLIVPTVP